MLTLAHALQVFVVLLKVIFGLSLLALLLIAADLSYYEYKGWKREDRAIKKVEEAYTHSDTPNIDALIRNAQAQKKYHTHSEESAWKGFFEEHYIRGFENNGALRHYGVRVPSRKAYRFFQEMDRLADEVIFDNTKEL